MVVIAFTSFGYPASTPTTVEAYFFDGIFNRLSPLMRQLWYTEHRDIFAACTAFLILAGIVSSSWIGGAIRRVLSWHIFRPIAQLSYSLYLVHEMLLFWIFPKSTWRLLRFLGPYPTIAMNSIFALCAMFVCSAVLFVLIEKPSMDMRSLPAIRELT